MSQIINSINNVWPSVSLMPVYCSISSISSSQLNNMSTTHFQLLDSPGSGFANIPTQMTAYSSSGTAGTGSSSVNVVNASNTNITANTLFLSLAGTSELNTSAISVAGATTATYAIVGNTGTYVFGGSVSGTTQTCNIITHYFIIPLV